jgi:hypothetical protein
VRVRFLRSPSAHRGELLSAASKGREVHAASFVRKRLIVLDEALVGKPREMARIIVHELFHFVWPRLSNGARRAWETVLEDEIRRRARGELGFSAEWRKQKLSQRDLTQRTRRWREYACESFCDSAAWRYAGVRQHAEFTLSKAFRDRRRLWFCNFLAAGRISI